MDNLECEYHSKQPGFIDTELLYDGNKDSWMMIQHWKSMDELKKASKKMFEESVTEAFRASLNTKSISIHAYPQIKVWE